MLITFSFLYISLPYLFLIPSYKYYISHILFILRLMRFLKSFCVLLKLLFSRYMFHHTIKFTHFATLFALFTCCFIFSSTIPLLDNLIPQYSTYIVLLFQFKQPVYIFLVTLLSLLFEFFVLMF